MTDHDFDATYHDPTPSRSPRQRVEASLAGIVDQYGASLLRDAERLKLYLDQSCADASHEVAGVLAGLAQRVPQQLLAAHGDEALRGLLPHLVKALVDDARLDRGTATWVVRAWTHALALPVTAAERQAVASPAPRATRPLDFAAIVTPRVATPGASRAAPPTAPAAVTTGPSAMSNEGRQRDGLGHLEASTVPRGEPVARDEGAAVAPAPEPPLATPSGPIVTRPTDTFWIIDPAEAPEAPPSSDGVLPSGTMQPAAQAPDPFVATEPEAPPPREPEVASAGPAPIESALPPSAPQSKPDTSVENERPGEPEPEAIVVPIEPASAIATSVVEEPPMRRPVDDASVAHEAPAPTPPIAVAPPIAAPAPVARAAGPRAPRVPVDDAISWTPPPARGNARTKWLAIGAAVVAIAIVIVAGRWSPRPADEPAPTSRPPVASSASPATSVPQSSATDTAASTAPAPAEVVPASPSPATTEPGTAAAPEPAPATPTVADATPAPAVAPAQSDAVTTAEPTPPPTAATSTPPEAAAATPATISRIEVPRVVAGHPFTVVLGLAGDTSSIAAVERRVVDGGGRAPASATVTPLSALTRNASGALMVPVRAPDAASTTTLQFALVDRKGVRSAPRNVVVRVEGDRERGARAIAVECTRATCGSVVALRELGGRQVEVIVRLDDRSIHTLVQAARWRPGARVQKVGSQFVLLSGER